VSAAFNPYHEWLGLDDGIEAPNYYQLLGTPLFTDDHAQLMAAVDRALVRVRSFRPGPQAAAWASLLDELAQVKACFQDPTRKAQYDERLRQGLARGPANRPARDSLPPLASVNQNPDLYPPGMAPVMSPADSDTHTALPPDRRLPDGDLPDSDRQGRPIVHTPVAPGPVNAHVGPPRDNPASLLPMAAAVAAVLVVVTLIVLMIALRDNASGASPAAPPPLPSSATAAPAHHRQVAAPPVAPESAPLPAAARPLEIVPSGPEPPVPADDLQQAVASTPVPDAPAPPGNGPPVPPENGSVPEAAALPAELPAALPAELDKALRQARDALADHDFRVAGRILEKAATLAGDPDQRAMVERVRELGQRAEQFWAVVSDAAAQLHAAEELSIGTAGELVVVVVEAGPDAVTIRRDGRNVKYALAEMPAGLALAIARRVVDTREAETLVLFGACLLTARDATPAYVEQARRYWEQAQQLGADVDGLLHLLNGV